MVANEHWLLGCRCCWESRIERLTLSAPCVLSLSSEQFYFMANSIDVQRSCSHITEIPIPHICSKTWLIYYSEPDSPPSPLFCGPSSPSSSHSTPSLSIRGRGLSFERISFFSVLGGERIWDMMDGDLFGQGMCSSLRREWGEGRMGWGWKSSIDKDIGVYILKREIVCALCFFFPANYPFLEVFSLEGRGAAALNESLFEMVFFFFFLQSFMDFSSTPGGDLPRVLENCIPPSLPF